MRIYIKRENWDGGLWLMLPAWDADAQKLLKELQKIHPSVMLPFVGEVDSGIKGLEKGLVGEPVFEKGHLEIKRRKNRGVYENFTYDRDKKIILNNDNDEQRRLFESCELKGKRICNPIVDWTDRDIWDYIRSERLPMNPLYSMGFFRVGCIGCPMAGKRRWMEFSIFSTYKQAYLQAFGRMLDVIHAEGISTKWKTAGDVFSWWMEDEQIEGQMSLDDLEDWKHGNE